MTTISSQSTSENTTKSSVTKSGTQLSPTNYQSSLHPIDEVNVEDTNDQDLDEGRESISKMRQKSPVNKTEEPERKRSEEAEFQLLQQEPLE